MTVIQRQLLAARVMLAVSWALAILSVVLHLGWAVDAAMEPFDIIAAFLAPAGALVGAHTKRHNPLTWVLGATGVWSAIATVAGQYAPVAVAHDLPAAATVAWVATWAAVPSRLLAFVIVVLIFPNGRVRSRPWRALGAGAVALSAARLLTAALRPGPLPVPGATSLDNPFGLAAAAAPAAVVGTLWGWLLPVAATAAVASLVLRYLDAHGEARRQIRLYLCAYSLGVIGIALPSGGAVLTAVLVPAAIGGATARYRTRSGYAFITATFEFALLGAYISTVYVAVVAGGGRLLGVSSTNTALAIAATTIIASSFARVRRRASRAASRLVHGERATPYEVLVEFTHRSADAYDLETVLPAMAEAAATGVAADAAEVAVHLADGRTRRAVWPPDLDTDPEWTRVLAVTVSGDEVGSVAVATGRPLTPVEDRLLDDLAMQAGPALRNVALTAELADRLAELSALATTLRASRARIVAAQDEQRRRMERDIHDGAQQQLVAISVKLTAVQLFLDRDPDRAAELLEDLTGEVQATLDGLRDLARGIFPPALTDRGLLAALEAHVAKHELPVTIDADVSLRSDRFHRDVEVAAYFCCLEALQNATKHAPGAPISVRLTARDGVLQFAVADEGPGFDTQQAVNGAGMQNMRDRVEALGGTLTVASVPGQGTVVVGTIADQPAERSQAVARVSGPNVDFAT